LLATGGKQVGNQVAMVAALEKNRKKINRIENILK